METCLFFYFFFLIFFMFFENFTFPFDALIHFTFSFIFKFPLRRARPRGGPYFLPLQKVGKDRRKGVSPPCESPDQSGVLDAPFGNPQVSLRYPDWPNSSPLRGWSFGAVGESASACALATIAAPPPLRGGGFAPLPPKVPKWGRLPVHARQRMGQRSKRLLAAKPRKSPEAPAAKRLGVPSLPSRGCGRRPL